MPNPDFPERDHGYGDSPTPDGPPRIAGRIELDCPNCGCPSMFRIQVDVSHPLVKGDNQVGDYVGCPACPFASPMIISSAPSKKADNKS